MRYPYPTPDEGGLMPTYEAGCDFVARRPGAIWKVGMGVASRALVMSVGLAAVGVPPKKLALYAFGGSVAVELAALLIIRQTAPASWLAR